MLSSTNPNPIVEGSVFGDLTVLYDSGKRNFGYIVWHCRCACGNEVDYSSRELRRGSITDCGGRSHISHVKKKIKPGDRFGQLTVISDSGERKKRMIAWICRCDCGNEILADTNSLKRGSVTDCGCISSLKTNLIGQKFGRLTVIGDEGVQNGDHMWLCRCDCGNECISTSSHLTHGENKSCGCLHDSIGKENLRLVDGTSVTKLEKRRGKLTASNSSGYNGVYPHSNRKGRDGRWAAQIGFKGKRYNLGTFDRVEDAARARKEAEEKLYDNFLKWYYDEYLPNQKEVQS